LNSQLLPNITEYSVSVDAGSSEVYENVRRGGRWDILLENFDFLSELKKNHLVTLNFAIQKSNYEDLFNFVNVCNKYSFAANIHQLDDWGTWNSSAVLNPDAWTIKNGTLADHDVLCKTHPEYSKCVDVVNSVIAANKHNKKIMFASRLKSLLQ